jgi:proton glutamate symport protein
MKLGLWVLAALALGLVSGSWIDAAGGAGLKALAGEVTVLGDLWLDALRMTLAPLIFALLVAAIGQMAETARVGPLARRALVLFAVLIVLGGTYSVLATHGLLALLPVDPAAAAALNASASGGAADVPAAEPIAFGAWIESLIPTNVVAAAAQDATLPLVVFACLFGVAVTQLEPARRAVLTGFFQAAAQAMTVIVHWVLLLAPLGVFGLALSLGLSSGFQTVGLLAHYVALVSAVTIGVILLSMLLGIATAGLSPLAFVRAVAPPQVVAASTQSSLATLPAMLEAARGPMGVAPRIAEFVLPLAVAVFRQTSPVANLAVAVFVCHLSGVEPGVAQWIAAIAVAFAVSVSSVGLPGQSSFFASVAPICLALGAPVTVLPLLLAVEVIPDVFRTIGNVTADLSVTGLLARWEARQAAQRGADAG